MSTINKVLILLVGLLLISFMFRAGHFNETLTSLGYEKEFWTATRVIAIALIFCLGAAMLSTNTKINREFAGFFLILFGAKILFGFFSHLFYEVPFTVGAYFNYSQYFLVPLAATFVLRSARALPSFLRLLVGINFFSVLVGWYNFLNRIQISGLPSNVSDFPRMGVGAEYGMFGASDYSVQLLMLLPVCTYVYLEAGRDKNSRASRFFLLVNLIGNLMNQVLTFHRSGIVLSLFVVGYFAFMERSRVRILFASVLLAAMAILFVSTMFGFDFLLLERMAQIPGILALDASSVTDDPAVAGRLLAQAHAIGLFLSHPLFGIGHGNFLTPHFGVYNMYDLFSAENMYLMMLAESGIGFFLIFLVLNLRVLTRGRGGQTVDLDLYRSARIALITALVLGIGSTIETNPWYLLQYGILMSSRS